MTRSSKESRGEQREEKAGTDANYLGGALAKSRPNKPLSRRLTAYARASLPLSGTAERQRWAHTP